jgi:hypothetical protein
VKKTACVLFFAAAALAFAACSPAGFSGSPAPASPAPNNLPENYHGVPIMPGAVSGEEVTGEKSYYKYLTGSPVQEVKEFYLAEMPRRGWEAGEILGDTGWELDTIQMRFYSRGEDFMIYIAPAGKGLTQVTVFEET